MTAAHATRSKLSPTPRTASKPVEKITSNKRYVLGIDVGGTGIGAQLFEVVGGIIAQEPVAELSQPGRGGKGEETQKGKAAHIAQITSIITWANNYVPQDGKLMAVGIASPGRFNAQGAIKPGTNTNLEAIPGEMDNVNLQYEYTRALEKLRLPNAPKIIVHNDGNAMLAGMLDAIAAGTTDKLTDQFGNEINAGSLQGSRVAVLGIGTGVGHAIADVSESGQLEHFVTDGHASKLWVHVDEADLAHLHTMLEKVNSRISDPDKKIAIVENDAIAGEVRAEDLFRAPVINALADLTNEEIKAGAGRDPQEEKLKAALSFAGKYMARTIGLIRSGESTDVTPANAWSMFDRHEAELTDMYLVGGDFGRKLGSQLVAAAQHEIETNPSLSAVREDGVQLVQYKGKNVAERAAATMIPPELYQNKGRELL